MTTPSLVDILLLAVGVLWSVAGLVGIALAIHYRNGVYAGEGFGWAGVAAAAVLAAPGPVMIFKAIH